MEYVQKLLLITQLPMKAHTCTRKTNKLKIV